MDIQVEIEKSEICEYFKDKHILLTGATGTLGKLIVEKLLRICKPAKIYLIIRASKSKDPQSRLMEQIQSPVFHQLRTLSPDFMKRLAIVPGDISAPGLGLSDTDVQYLMEKVQIVFHGAATVKFDEPLTSATKTNVIGTRTVIELCKKMKNLESVVHISTAYSHCPNKEIKEEFYETPTSSDNLIKMIENIRPQEIDALTPHIKGKWPNIYAFTKAVAEETVRKNGEGLPIAIFRPGILLTTRNDPVPNWLDHLYGPIGTALGCILGVVRVIRINKECRGEFLPTDMTVNCLLAIGYKTATSRKPSEIPIYNFTSHPSNPATWGDLYHCMRERCDEIPSSQTFWHYSAIVAINNRVIYYLMAFFLHILPALMIDIGLVAICKKPRALKIYKKIHHTTDLFAYFTTNTWRFSMDNTNELWKSLNHKDRKLFDFDMASLDYRAFLRGTIDGVIVYILKEDTDINYRKRRYFVLYIVDRLVKFSIISGLLWCSCMLINWSFKISFSHICVNGIMRLFENLKKKSVATV